MDAAKELESDGKKVRVVSMVSWELFEEQDQQYKVCALLNLHLNCCNDEPQVVLSAHVVVDMPYLLCLSPSVFQGSHLCSR